MESINSLRSLMDGNLRFLVLILKITLPNRVKQRGWMLIVRLRETEDVQKQLKFKKSVGQPNAVTPAREARHPTLNKPKESMK
jgi:hypothetical protein